MQREILVPLDGSALAETAIPHAASLARYLGAGLTLLRAIPTPVIYEPMIGAVPPSSSIWDMWEDEVEDARGYLTEVERSLRADGIDAQSKIIEEQPANAIIGYAAENPGVELIAMATHGRSGFGRWIFGSVAEKVLRGASKPLLLVRPRTGDTPAKPELHDYKLIVVPLDGSPFAEQALAEAEEVARAASATLAVLSVVPSPSERAAPEDIGGDEFDTHVHGAEVEHMTHYVMQTAHRLEKDGFKVQQYITEGRPAEAILKTCEHLHADLIVMATHGRSGLERLWLGSVAMKVVQGAVTPVLLIRAKEPAEPVSENAEQQEMVTTV